MYYIVNCVWFVEGELLLIDVGVEVDCYVLDISCSFLVSGCYLCEQCVLYDIVLIVQLVVIDEVCLGCLFNVVYMVVVQVIVEGLCVFGLFKGGVDVVIVIGSYWQFFFVKIGYWFGLDVYDVGDYCIDGELCEFELGMVVMVELGIYVLLDDCSVFECWCGIGICIEDDVVVICCGNEVFIVVVLKEFDVIEVLLVVC